MALNATVEKSWNGTVVKVKGKRITNKSAFEIGLIVEGQAKLLAPIKKGRLRGSITTQSGSNGSAPEAPAGAGDTIASPTDDSEVLVGTAVEYAPYVEFGTVRSHAQPFLRPALDLAKGKALTVMEKNGRIEFSDYLK